jgi:hypothetical protein
MSMPISGVTQQSSLVSGAKTRDVTPDTTEKTTPPVQDKVTLSDQPASDVTYGDPRGNTVQQRADLAAMLEESDRKATEIINLIRPLVEQQGLNFSKVVSGEQKLKIDPAKIDAAKAAIGEDGEFGVRKTAERILSFAKGAIGGDPAKLDKIRAAVEKGFDEAAKILGGSLPEISQQTLKTIQTEFDRWKNDGIPGGDTVSLSQTKDASQGRVG